VQLDDGNADSVTVSRSLESLLQEFDGLLVGLGGNN
jgi:hypothetical protein